MPRPTFIKHNMRNFHHLKLNDLLYVPIKLLHYKILICKTPIGRFELTTFYFLSYPRAINMYEWKARTSCEKDCEGQVEKREKKTSTNSRT